MKRHDLVDLDLLIIHETEKAILVSDAKKEVWLPKSAVEFRQKGGGRLYEITMSEGLALEKGLV